MSRSSTTAETVPTDTPAGQDGSVGLYGADRPFGYQGGTFSEDEVADALANHRPLTLDLAIPGQCRNACEYCGYYGVNATDKLTPAEITSIIDQFASLGGKSVKILGEGEPLLRGDILELLAAISQRGMAPVLFTCGDVLGNKEVCRKTHGCSAERVVKRLFDIGCTVVLKFDSWHQDDIVGRAGYTEARDHALRLLLEGGFNETSPSRLGFGIVLLKRNYSEVPSIFRFALQHNIYPLVCPLMPIGRSSSKEYRARVAPTRSETHALSARLVQIRREYGVDDVRLSDFPGGLPCDVSCCGMYVDDQGKAMVCEADECVGSVRTADLDILWTHAERMKDTKYRGVRHRGLCSPKRLSGIL